MGKSEGIRIFLRIRPPMTAAQSRLLGSDNNNSNNNNNNNNSNSNNDVVPYEVEHTFDSSHLKLHLSRKESNEVINNSSETYTYTFRRVFEPRSTQEDVFNTVAVECVQSFLDGVNATIFAYGQTGSGKTYSITGGTDSYEDRGIIPRSLKMIYDQINSKRNEFNYTVSISYLQIYNLKGQDLLNHGKDARSLEELPNVTIHDTGSSTVLNFDSSSNNNNNNSNNNSNNGEVILKGLESHFAPTLADALNLLFLGDTNRLYCETPMNKTSSRSHCIFTISLEARPVNSTSVRYSKLNLVDLAGSERVARSQISGNLLNEAKHINLSLHYLEHVILSLGQAAASTSGATTTTTTTSNNNTNTSMSADSHLSMFNNKDNNTPLVHIPFRNSFMTMVLKDSLGRNCKTVMLATAHLSYAMLPETISTCAFAQRVALIKQSPSVNVTTDPALLIKQLKAEVASLKDRLSFYENSNSNNSERVLDNDERCVCKRLVEEYIHEPNTNIRFSGFKGDFARIYYCFQVIKEMFVRNAHTTPCTSLTLQSSSSESHHRGVLANKVCEGKEGNLMSKVNNEFNSMNNTSDINNANSESNNNSVVTLRQTVETLQHNLQHKENEMNILLELLHKTQSTLRIGEVQTSHDEMLCDIDRESVLSQIALLRSAAHKAVTHSSTNNTTSNTTTTTTATTPTQPLATLQTQWMQKEESNIQVSSSPHSSSDSCNHNDSSPSPEVLLQHVQEMSHAGQLNKEQARAASEYLQTKFNNLSDKYNLNQLTFSNEALIENRAAAFEAFKISYKNYDKVETAKSLLKEKYMTCKQTAKQLNATVDTIKHIKREIQRLRAERVLHSNTPNELNEESKDETQLLESLSSTKTQYNEYANALKAQKEDIEAMHAFMKRSQEQLTHDYEEWLTLRNQQLALQHASINKNNNNSNSNDITAINDNNNNNDNNIIIMNSTSNNNISNEIHPLPSSTIIPLNSRPHSVALTPRELTQSTNNINNNDNRSNNLNNVVRSLKATESKENIHYAHSEPSTSQIISSSTSSSMGLFASSASQLNKMNNIYDVNGIHSPYINNNNNNNNNYRSANLDEPNVNSPKSNNWVKPIFSATSPQALPRITNVRTDMERVVPLACNSGRVLPTPSTLTETSPPTVLSSLLPSTTTRTQNSNNNNSNGNNNGKLYVTPSRLEPLPITTSISPSGTSTSSANTNAITITSNSVITNSNNTNTNSNNNASASVKSSPASSSSASSCSANTNYLSSSSIASNVQTLSSLRPNPWVDHTSVLTSEIKGSAELAALYRTREVMKAQFLHNSESKVSEGIVDKKETGNKALKLTF